MKGHLDEAAIQAYLDGELSTDSAREAAAHLSACDSCADAVATAEQESAFFAAAFGPDESLTVPSEVLRANVNAAVARLETGGEARRGGAEARRLGSLFATLAGLFSFAPRHAAAYAGALAVLVFAVLFFVAQRDRLTPAGGEQAPQLATKVTPKESSSSQESAEVARAEATRAEPNATPTPQSGNEPSRFIAVKSSKRRPAVRREADKPSAAPAEEEPLLPGEKNYREAIASLERTIKMSGDAVLRPSVRADYERNLAIINKAIDETRGVAASNPKDRDAVDFLMAAYRSKVELLTTVADQAQVATLGR